MAESDNILTKLHDVLLYLIPERTPTSRRLFPAQFWRGTKTAMSRVLVAEENTLAKSPGSVRAQQIKRSELAVLGRALGVLLFLVSTMTYGQGVVQRDSADFTLNTTDASAGTGGVAQRDSADFTLDTTGTPTGVGGTAQRDSADFLLNTTGESPRVYRDSNLFTLDTGGPQPTPATLSAPAYLSDNRFQFSVSGAAGLEYVIQANTNLSTANWVSLFTNTAPFTFTDTGAGSYMQRFYRAVYVP